ncbi:MAG: hypothetical protein GXO94_05100 [Nitrospirae bacterium]|nr:hypothetical protein [Nitrospirota bacterium]
MASLEGRASGDKGVRGPGTGISVTIRLFAFVAGLTILLISSVPASSSILLDRVVAVVGRDVITWSELYKAMEFELGGKLAGLSPEEKKEQLKKYEKDFLRMLIDMKIQLNEARRLNIGVSKEDVESAIGRIRQKYGLSETAFLKALKKEGFSLEEYKKKVSEQITLSKLVNLEIRSKILVTEKEIDDYIEANSDSIDLSEGYRVRHIFFPVGTPEEKAAAERKADEVMKLLESGDPFEDLARRFSEGSDASSGGDLGVIKKNDLAPEFLKVIEGLKVGEHSTPFWSGRGLHIIKLEGVYRPDDEAALRKKVREILIEKKLRDALNDYIRSLRSKVFIEVKL